MTCDVQGRFQGTKDVVWLRGNLVGWHRGQDRDFQTATNYTSFGKTTESMETRERQLTSFHKAPIIL